MSIQKYTDKLIKVNSTDLAQPYSTWGHFYNEIYGYSHAQFHHVGMIMDLYYLTKCRFEQ